MHRGLSSGSGCTSRSLLNRDQDGPGAAAAAHSQPATGGSGPIAGSRALPSSSVCAEQPAFCWALGTVLKLRIYNPLKPHLSPWEKGTLFCLEETEARRDQGTRPYLTARKRHRWLVGPTGWTLDEPRERETLKLRAPRKPAPDSRGSPPPPCPPSAAGRRFPYPRGGTKSLLSPRRGEEGPEGSPGRGVNSPNCEEPQPQPRLPTAEVPRTTHGS